MTHGQDSIFFCAEYGIVKLGSTLALEMRCFHKLLGIAYRDHTTNEEVKARIGIAIGPYEDLLTSVKRRKLKWYGHATRSSGLAKTILQGTVQEGRRRGRQIKRWEDNIKEWSLFGCWLLNVPATG